MMTKKYILLLVLAIITVELLRWGVSSSTTVKAIDLPDLKALRMEIAANIKPPARYHDTIFYSTSMGLCGNSTQEEIDKYLNTRLNEQPFWDFLLGVTSATFVFLPPKKAPPANHVVLTVVGEAISNSSMKVYERYRINDETYSIDKLFVFRDNTWSFSIERELLVQ